MKILEKIKSIFLHLWSWFLKKPWRFVWIPIGIFVIFRIFNSDVEEFEKINVEKRDLSKTVLSSGEVLSSIDLNLSFLREGIVKEVNVEVGDSVQKGQILAVLNQDNLKALLTEALGNLKFTQAKLAQVIEGATSEEIILAEINLASAKRNLEQVKKEQEVLVLNARRNLYSSDLEAIDENGDSGIDVFISGVLNENKPGRYFLEVGVSGSDWVLRTPDKQKINGSVSDITQNSVGDTGLYFKFSTRTLPYGYSSYIDIPNNKGKNYSNNKSAYEAALVAKDLAILSAQNEVFKKEAELSLKKKIARPSEVSLAEAEVLQAEGRYLSAKANFEETFLKAPENGVITAVNVKIGEIPEHDKPSFVLKNTEILYIESNINESNIDLIYKGASVKIIFDAFPDKVYQGRVSFVEPSETLIGGVVNYKIKVELINIDESIRPGMTANLVTEIWNIKDAISLPNRAIFEENGTLYVLSGLGKSPEKKEIKRGKIADGAVAEILSGINFGDVVWIKK